MNDTVFYYVTICECTNKLI